MPSSAVEITSAVTVHGKYARFLKDKQRREIWSEIVDRNMEMHISNFPHMESEIRSIYNNYVMNKKVLPSMRSLQFSGPAIETTPTRIFNCAFLPASDYHAFSETMFLLLGGTGVGYSVQEHHVDMLPPVVYANRIPSKRYVVADSIEGWADAVKELMKAYLGERFTHPVFDFSQIREKGAELVTSGGRAPGAEPLIKALTKIESVLLGASGRKLRPFEAHRIMCLIADAVRAGGIRRAALISLFSKTDTEMLTAKSGAWWVDYPELGRANNSVILLRSDTSREEFDTIWDAVRASGAGEPGFFWTNDLEVGTNPCCETDLRPYQFCVAGDTTIMTRNGKSDIKSLVGEEAEIWNGEKWSKVTPFKTGDTDRLHRVWFSDGSYLDATDNHKFLVKHRFETEYRELETLDLINEIKTSKYKLSIPRANVSFPDGGTSYERAYEAGFVLGDGNVYNDYVTADLYGEDTELEFQGVIYHKPQTTSRGTTYQRIRFDISPEFARTLKYDEGLPVEVFGYDRDSALKFVAGWADADGSLAANGVRIYGREDKLRDGQLLLTKLGIHSSVNLMGAAGEETNLGVRRNSVWYLQFSKTVDIPFQRLESYYPDNPRMKGKDQIVSSIETLPGTHESFCFNEPELHQGLFANVLTKQCNLCEINGDNIVDQGDFDGRAYAAAFIGTLQASYTDFHYLRDIWKQTTNEDALLGIGITGIGSGKLTDIDLTQGANVAVMANSWVASAIGINKAARVTCVKPSGTSSLTLGTSSGIHAWYADFFIRTIRLGKNEALAQYLMATIPDLIEEDVSDSNQIVVSFPMKAPEGAMTRSESAIDTLERVKKFSTEWVKPGYRYGANGHNVSCTISVRETEWETTGAWMWDNRETYNGIAVLPFDDHTYQQAPFQDCDEATYDEMMTHVVNIDLTMVIEDHDETNLVGEMACSAGACTI